MSISSTTYQPVQKIYFRKDEDSNACRLGYLDSAAMRLAIQAFNPTLDTNQISSYQYFVWRGDATNPARRIFAQKDADTHFLGNWTSNNEIIFKGSNEALKGFIVEEAPSAASDVEKSDPSTPTDQAETTEKEITPTTPVVTSSSRKIWNGVKSLFGAVGSALWFLITLPARPFMKSSAPSA